MKGRLPVSPTEVRPRSAHRERSVPALPTAPRREPDHAWQLTRALQRVADAEAEFDAALAAGRPMYDLVARDRELTRAVVALQALHGSA